MVGQRQDAMLQEYQAEIARLRAALAEAAVVSEPRSVSADAVTTGKLRAELEAELLLQQSASDDQVQSQNTSMDLLSITRT